MNDKVGPLTEKMALFENWLKENEKYNHKDDVTKAFIILDALITATHSSRNEFFWIGMSTCAEQLLEVIQSQLSMEHDREKAPPLSPVAMTIASICVVNAKAQKIENIYMETGKIQVDLAQVVVEQYEEAKWSARNNTSIERETLVKMAKETLLQKPIKKQKKTLGKN